MPSLCAVRPGLSAPRGQAREKSGRSCGKRRFSQRSCRSLPSYSGRGMEGKRRLRPGRAQPVQRQRGAFLFPFSCRSMRFSDSHDDFCRYRLFRTFFRAKKALLRLPPVGTAPRSPHALKRADSFLFFLRSLSIMGVLSTCSSGLHSLSIRKGRKRKHSRHIHVSRTPEKKGRRSPACTKML